MTYRALDIHAHFRTGERKVLAEQNKDADKAFEQLFKSSSDKFGGTKVDHSPTDSVTIGLVLNRQVDPTGVLVLVEHALERFAAVG